MRTTNSDRLTNLSKSGDRLSLHGSDDATIRSKHPFSIKYTPIYSVSRLTKIRVSELTILCLYHQLAAMHHNEHSPSRTCPSWVKGMMARLEPGRVAEISTSGTEEVSLSFGRPDFSYTDPFILPAPSSQPAGSGQNLKIPIPLLSAAAPVTKSSSTDASHASESPLLSHASHTRDGGTVLEHLVRVIAAMQNDEKNGGERKVSVSVYVLLRSTYEIPLESQS
jgi:hypothetical protein